MTAGEARAPAPRRGDPNVKAVQMTLTPEEWRQLRALAAREMRSVDEVLADIVRKGLEDRPRPGL